MKSEKLSRPLEGALSVLRYADFYFRGDFRCRAFPAFGKRKGAGQIDLLPIFYDFVLTEKGFEALPAVYFPVDPLRAATLNL